MRRIASFVPIVLFALAPAAQAQLTIRSAAGADPSAIQSTVTQFRTDLGGANNGVGAFAGSGGRREINWDGVPSAFSAPNNLPGNFFNVNSPRGAVFSGAAGFQVSDNAAGGNSAGVRFDNLNSSYSAQFQSFSSQKLFTSLGSNVYDVAFFLPGTTTPALVSGFASVFTDVDVAGTTSIQFFDINNLSLGAFAAAPASSGLSFLGGFTPTPQIARVRITLGNTVIGPNDNDGSSDIVVADDFIYGEPVAASVAAPEPAALALVLLGLPLLKRRRH